MGRIEILRKLIMLNGNLNEILESLQQFEWDSDELVILKSNDIISLMKRYINLEISDSDVEDWANAIEGRDDINYTKNELFKEIIHELANPLLIKKLDYQRANEIIFELSR